MRSSPRISLVFDRVRHFLSPPVIPDDEYRTFSLRALHYTLLLLMGLLVIFPPFASSIVEVPSAFFVFLFALFIVALSYYFLHAGRHRLASALFIGGSWSGITVIAFLLNGIFNGNLNLYAILVLYSAFLFSERAVIVTTGLSILSCIILAFSEGQGVLPLHATPLYLADRLFQLAGLLGSAGLLLTLESRVMRTSFARIRADEQMLLRRNRELESEFAERRKAEQAQQASEARFRALVENSLDVVAIIQVDGVITFQSPSTKRQLGYAPEALVGRNAFDYIHPDDLPQVMAIFAEKSQQPGSIATIEYRFHHANGSWVYLESQATNLLDDPIIHGGVINSRDVTDRKRAEELLAKERILLRTVIDHLPDNIFVKDRESRFVLNNLASLAIMGMSRQEDVLGKGDVDFFPPELAEQWRAQEQAIMQSGQPILDVEEFQPWHTDKRRWIIGSTIPLRDEQGEVFGVLGVSRDITERKQAEERLRASEEGLRQLSDAAWEGIGITDQGRIILINRQMAEMFGYERDELVGQSVLVLVAPESRELVTSNMRAGYDQPYEHVAIRKDGTTFPVEVLGRVMVYQGGQVRVTAVRDITVRKEAEEQRLRAERLRVELETERELNELKSRFVSLVSHEFRTPLAAIGLASDQLRQYGSRLTEEEKATRVESILAETRHMAAMIEQVLTISRIEAGKLVFSPAPVNVQQFAQDIVDSLQTSTATHHFVFSPQGEPCMARVDAELLQHILLNLLTNAVKYSAAGSAVTLDVQCQPEQIVFHVRDEGIGIPPQDRPHLFEPFHRASNVGSISGTGLGLSIVKQMVERHGGSITFDSTVGVGTTFTVVIPTNPPTGEQEQEPG